MLKSRKYHCLSHRFSGYNILTDAIATNRPTIQMHFIRNSSGLMLEKLYNASVQDFII